MRDPNGMRDKIMELKRQAINRIWRELHDSVWTQVDVYNQILSRFRTPRENQICRYLGVRVYDRLERDEE